VDEKQFVVVETNRENHRIYYLVKADGVELPSLVCIFASHKRADSEKELESGVILHANLSAEHGRSTYAENLLR
jgi:hypothetical protein